jgi:3-dehydroquinate synthetase
MSAMSADKKAMAGRLKFVLPESIGKVRIEEDVDRELIQAILSGNS